MPRQVARVGASLRSRQSSRICVLTDAGKEELDTLVINARQLYLSPKEADRQKGLEKFWAALSG